MESRPVQRQPRRTRSSGPARFVVLAEIVILGLGLVLVAGLRAPSQGPVGGPPAFPSLDPTATPSATPTLPTVPPTDSPAPTPTPVPTPTPTPIPTPVPAPTGPPACAYDDLLTEHHAYRDWPITLLDTIYRLPGGYIPGDLRSTSAAGLAAVYQVRALVIADLRAMTNAAQLAGSPIQVASAYRSHDQQIATFQRWVDVVGYERALQVSARAGHSEHQLGTTLDFTSRGGLAPWEYADWATTPAGAWMRANAWHFGFVMSYPKGAIADTCYAYEPWHYRYVGRETAAAIHESDLTPREYLWRFQ
jgi:D-alanyl-D-alanine carboxypeptidase